MLRAPRPVCVLSRIEQILVREERSEPERRGIKLLTRFIPGLPGLLDLFRILRAHPPLSTLGDRPVCLVIPLTPFTQAWSLSAIR